MLEMIKQTHYRFSFSNVPYRNHHLSVIIIILSSQKGGKCVNIWNDMSNSFPRPALQNPTYAILPINILRMAAASMLSDIGP
jgi:hypothetical protein